jgi:voltage-gated potassium channel
MQEKQQRNIYPYLIAAALFVLVVGTIFYHLEEHLSWVDAYYFSVITLTTVGYGDIVPHTPAGKIFTTFYILFGVGIITTFITYTMRRRGERFERHKDARQQKRLQK